MHIKLIKNIPKQWVFIRFLFPTATNLELSLYRQNALTKYAEIFSWHFFKSAYFWIRIKDEVVEIFVVEFHKTGV